MKNIPNIISILRILLSILIAFLNPQTPLFMGIYSICGVSDIIDGYIARKTNSTSTLGSILDSIADAIFMISVSIVFLPTLSIPFVLFLWIIFIIFIRGLSLSIVYFKYHTFAILHTYSNKATGLLLFFCPYLSFIINITTLSYIVCAIASMSALEELFIHIASKKLVRDTPSIYSTIT